MPLQEASSSRALSPSEVVLLNGERFATPSGSGVELLHVDMTVSANELLPAIVCVALVACERNGELSLTVGKRRRLTTVHYQVVIEPRGRRGRWPDGSLEAQIGPA